MDKVIVKDTLKQSEQCKEGDVSSPLSFMSSFLSFVDTFDSL